MNRPRARAGRTPISSSVRIVDAPAAVGVGSGDPWSIGGGGAGGDDSIARIDVVSGPLTAVPGRGSTPTPPARVAARSGDAAATPRGDVPRWGRGALTGSRSPPVCRP